MASLGTFLSLRIPSSHFTQGFIIATWQPFSVHREEVPRMDVWGEGNVLTPLLSTSYSAVLNHWCGYKRRAPSCPLPSPLSGDLLTSGHVTQIISRGSHPSKHVKGSQPMLFLVLFNMTDCSCTSLVQKQMSNIQINQDVPYSELVLCVSPIEVNTHPEQ